MNLKNEDELIISDDGSTDRTLDIIKNLYDKRIVLVDGPRKGFVKNFENGIRFCKNDIVFFSDQDDIWVQGKRDIIVSEFESGINLVKHDAIIVDENLNVICESYNKLRGANSSYLKNVLANTFTGCCMAVNRDWLIKMLPVPENIYHDWWLGVLACKFKCAKIIPDKLLLYRRHSSNTSQMKPHSIFFRIRDRYNIVKNLKIKVRQLKELNVKNK